MLVVVLTTITIVAHICRMCHLRSKPQKKKVISEMQDTNVKKDTALFLPNYSMTFHVYFCNENNMYTLLALF